MKVLVTGGAGFIGGNFVHHMVNKYPDYQIVNLDLLTYAGNLETLKPVEDKPNYKFVKGDIADEAFIMDLFEKEKFDVVVNFAAESHVDRSIENPGIFLETNIMGTSVLMDACRKYGIKRVVVSTYQSVTGSGLKGINQLEGEREGREVKKAYAHPIDRNCLPHCDSFTDNGYTKEEMKLVNETCKILNDDTIKVTATAVRVPVMGGHSESVNIEFKQDYDLDELRDLLAHSEGIIVQDDPAQNLYPMAITANEKDEVFVGRLRRDFSQPNSLNLWVVSDNLRKGAATNAVQIAEYLYKHDLL